jgi:hypothetical protein
LSRSKSGVSWTWLDDGDANIHRYYRHANEIVNTEWRVEDTPLVFEYLAGEFNNEGQRDFVPVQLAIGF